MKFTVSRDYLFNALQNIIGVVPSKATMPILQNIKMYSEDGLLKLMATDIEIMLVTWIPAEIEEEGASAVPARTLFDIIRELPSTELTISIDDHNRATIKTEFGEYKIIGQSAAEFPKLPIVDAQSEINFDNQLLMRLIDKTIYTCAKDDLRPALNGVFMTLQNKLVAVSTDSHRLTKLEITDEAFSGKSFKALMPIRALNFVLRLLSDEGNTTIFFGDKHALFNISDTLIYTRLIYNEQFPSYERVLPTEFESQMNIDKDAFISSLKRIKIFASKLTHQVYMNIYPDYVELSAEDVDFGGEGHERISCEFTGENLFMAFNANYLLEILQHIDDERIVLHMNSINTPAVIMPENQDESQHQLVLIMPVKVVVKEE
ncbi:MAG: DNA polymerase III subunit beta [Calditrichia bacterium]